MRRLFTVVLLAGTVAACSSSSDDGGDEATPTAADTTTTTTAPAYESEVYVDRAHWLCRGDVDDDPCDTDLDATVVDADGTSRTERFEPAADAPVDCFYVYPTVSVDQSVNSDLEPAQAEITTARLQAARLGAACRVYAPVYRQTTLTMLISRITGADPPPGDASASRQVAYDDVLDAFRHFLANDSDGRGFVLVGHSQGAGHLDRLVAEEIDGDADLRRRLVSAMLLGTSIAVDEYDHVPPCTAPDDTGCVISYASFRDRTPPPAGSFFGRDDGGPALCSNPADLAGGGPAELDAFLPAQNRSLIGANDAPVTWATGVDIRTPFVRVPGLITGECVDDGTFGYLRVTVDGDPADPRADDIRGDLTPEWGLHLVDVQLAMGDLVQLVRTQGEAYAK